MLFAGGGTGGHIYPAIALADALKPRAVIRFAGSADRLEASLVPQAGYDLRTISSAPLSRESARNAAAAFAHNAAGIAQAIAVVREFSPDIVIATGGYVCFPVVVAAWLLRSARQLRCAIALVEPNAEPGLTNRVLAPFVDEVWGAFPDAPRVFAKKFRHTGVPIRESLRTPRIRVEAARRLQLDAHRTTIVAVGGSQGARTINQSVAALVTRRTLPGEWQVLHISGERDYAFIAAEEREINGSNRVSLVPYLHDMGDAYELADVVVARAGASTLGEVAAFGLPSVLIPYPHAAGDHQRKNAEVFARVGAAAVLEDSALDADSLWWTLREVLEPQRLERMRSAARSLGRADAVTTIIARVEGLAPRNSGHE